MTAPRGHTEELALAALSLVSRARSPPRAHTTCTAHASGAARGLEAAADAKQHIVQLLRAHAIITVTRTYGMKSSWAHAPLCTRRRCSVTTRIHSMQ